MLDLRKRYNHAVTQAHYCRESIDWLEEELKGALAIGLSVETNKVCSLKDRIKEQEDNVKMWAWLACNCHKDLIEADEFDLSIDKEKRTR